MAIIHAEQITRSFGKLQVLNQVDLIVEKGEIVSITGPSGAGKTTLLQIIGTLDKANSGRVYIDNQEVSAMNGNALAAFRNQHIGFVFQFHHLLPEFTALENVCIPAFIAGKSRSFAEKRAKDLLDFLGLKERMDHKPSELSGGEAQRVAVARALVNQPTVILADEPSGNLDEQNSKDLYGLFHSLRQEFDQSFVVVTHDPMLASQSDRIVKLVDGRVVD